MLLLNTTILYWEREEDADLFAKKASAKLDLQTLLSSQFSSSTWDSASTAFPQELTPHLFQHLLKLNHIQNTFWQIIITD